MSDPKPVHIGEILSGIRAADHNGFFETWRKVNQTRAPFTTPPQSSFADRLVVSVFNDTGSLIDADFPILKLTGPAFNAGDREGVIHEPIAFDGDTPDEDTAEGDFAIIQGPIGDGQKGQGVITGHSWVSVNWTDEAHEFAAVEDGENTRLKSAESGIKIIWHEEIPDPEYLPMELWAVVKLGGGGSTTSTPLDMEIVLINYASVVNGDEEVIGAVEDDPEEELEESDILRTDEEFENEVPVFFQNPIPDDPNDYDSNHVTSLRLMPYQRGKWRVQKFRTPVNRTVASGTAQSNTSTTVELQAGSSEVDGFLEGAIFTINAGDDAGLSGPITDHTGLVVTVDFESAPTVSITTYTITRPEPGFDLLSDDKLILDYTVIRDNSDPDNPQIIVRPVYVYVLYDDTDADTIKTMVLQEYQLEDYPGYPDGEVFPPDGSETYQEFTPNELRKSYVWLAIGGVLVTGACKARKPTPLREVES